MHHTLLANGRKIHYQLERESPGLPFVLLHGFCEDGRVWDAVMPHLPGDFPVLRIDLPGFGDSDAPLHPGMEGYADAVCAVVNDLGFSRVVMAGHSMGGYTALAFAEQYPERLAGLGLVHSHPFADKPEQAANRDRGIAMLREGKKDLYVRQLMTGLFPEAFARLHPEVVEAMVAQAQRHPVEGIIAALEGMRDRKARTEQLGEAGWPVLMLLGEADHLVPEAYREAMLDAPSLADLHILPGIGHMGLLESPEASGKILGNFWHLCSQRLP